MYRLSILFGLLWFPQCTQFNLLDQLENPAGSLGYKVFVSSAFTTGDFANFNVGTCTGNDIFRALCVCQTLANAAGISRINTQYIPWLSTSTVAARCLLKGQNTNVCAISGGDAGPWFNMKGEMVTQGLVEMVNGPLLTAIRYNEKGEDMGNTSVYTGTLETGIMGNDCTSWTGSGSVNIGDSGSSSLTWTNKDATAVCTSLRSIYCFEIKK